MVSLRRRRKRLIFHNAVEVAWKANCSVFCYCYFARRMNKSGFKAVSGQVKSSEENNFGCVVSAQSRHEVRDGFRRTRLVLFLFWFFRGFFLFVSSATSADRDRGPYASCDA